MPPSPRALALDLRAPAYPLLYAPRTAAMHAIAFHTKRAFHGFLRFTRKPLAARGLTAARFDLLYVIEQPRAADSGHMGVWQHELRRKLGVCPSVVCRMLRSLLDLGLVSRRRSNADRRSWIITLTPQGIAAVDRAKRWLFREVRCAVHVAICFGKHRSPEARFMAMDNLESYLQSLRRQFRDFATLYYPWGHPDD